MTKAELSELFTFRNVKEEEAEEKLKEFFESRL